MWYDELVINLLFIWMGVGMGIWLIHYRSIKNSGNRDED
jgi:hypothetical protein